MKKIELRVLGMSCEGCERRIEKRLSSFKEVVEVHAMHKDCKVVITLKEELELNKIKDAIEILGFEVE